MKKCIPLFQTADGTKILFVIALLFATFSIQAHTPCPLPHSGNPEIDLELSMQATPNNFKVYETFVFTTTITNKGNTLATGVQVHLPQANGVVYSGGNEYSSSQGIYYPYTDQKWYVGSLAAGASATIDIRFFILQKDPPITAYAQVVAANENDMDSNPNNGTPPVPNEDDEAAYVLDGQPVLLATQNNVPPSGAAFSEVRIFGFSPDGQSEQLSSTMAPVNSNTTNFNGNAYDPVNGRFYFSRFDGPNQVSELFFNDLEGNQQSAGLLGAATASGTFYNGAYYYMAQLSDDFYKVMFNPNGTIANQMQVANIFAGTAYDGQWLGFGDIAFSIDGATVYGSATRAGTGATKVFFRMNADGSDYTEICDGSDCTYLNSNTQIAFGADSKLYGINTLNSREFLQINPLNGNSQLLGFFYTSFSDLAMGTAPLTGPDLRLTNNVVPILGEAGAVVSFQFDLENIGNVSATGDFLINHYLSTDPFFSPDDIWVGEVVTGNTPVGTIPNVAVSISIPANTAPGSYTIISVVDANNDVAELKENNNITSWPIEVRTGVICTGDIVLSTQAEVDAFGPCTVWEGRIDVDGDDITNLRSFAGLREIIGSLIIVNCPNLENLHGLEDLETTSRHFAIIGNGLKNVDAMTNLSRVGSDFVILSNPQLPNLDGFSGLNRVENLMYINNNPQLQNLDGLLNLNYVGGALEFMWNTQLKRINILSSMTELNGSVLILENDNLIDISGFSNIESMESIIIASNPALPNLHGLENLRRLGSLLVVHNNDLLQDLNPLSNMEKLDGDLHITDNAMLSNCCGLYPLLSTNGIAGNITIEDNPAFCSNETEILTYCVPKGIDLEVSMEGPPDFTIYEPFSLNIRVTNTGSETANAVVMRFREPMGTVFIGGDEYIASQGIYHPYGSERLWAVGSIAPGEQAILSVNLFPLERKPITAYTQVVDANEEDIDSSPANGTPPYPNEDDEAAIHIDRAYPRAGLLEADEVPSQFRPMVIHKIFPVPATTELTVFMNMLEAGRVGATIYNIQGSEVAQLELDLLAGFNKTTLDISKLPDGMYTIRFRIGTRHEPLRFIKKRL